jgi:hypothetical protein
MKLNDLHQKLVAVAKQNPPSDHVPYAFEKRIMSHLGSLAPLNHWALWGGPLWRAAASCVVITALCGLWAMTSNQQASSQESFSQAFEAAVFTPPVQHAEDAW